MRYTDEVDKIKPENLKGFFVGWPNLPSPERHLEILKNSEYVMLAIDEDTGNVVGFINALSDEILYAYIPLLEVLPEYQGKGIGTKLVNLMLEKLKNYYAIDICCDEELEPFYKRFGFQRVAGMIKRDHEKQNGRATHSA
ncbi:MAG: GNAT family N-acetyltransferase [Caldiserica bacterium CG02_land_8_20_14_3_00_36_38]|nr:GNAT family N-acetyltransferase [Caldisericota bacterium]OIP12034.1 MAG: GNAT family N-acetyltransferase [Caldisericum sp. CG2_30_36_11]PIP49957.1 MAG: GNAT family N-acetyltransferase [Caldiserica bacterium CG23_combo_of_CG06-09_8_20_14_all_35_60]PIV56480.1 MAG: GNAT family N-acetyltransferase [Caldiserica bacterium CG02_land_8_20_14_3_00_36_38]PIX29800.1 MAG: GNAT family N-acetyltransferase [Caldiserica bacterium CG_4_8_14_3_um_filter_35_18]